MQLRCLLDSIQVEEPIGLSQISKVVKRDKSEGSILVTQDAEVTFVGDGFDYLYNLLRNDGFCVRASCIVQITIDGGSTWTNYYEGLIPISAVEFDLKRNLAKTKIFDNSYNSKIDNSKSIGAFLYWERSRNNVAITPIPYQTIQYFSVTTGAYITQTFNGGYEGAAYRPFDVMRFLIEFMTDGEMGFSSSVFDTGGEYEGLLLTHGRAIELADQSLGCPSDCPPACTQSVWEEFWDKVDWETLFKEYRNRFNLAFAVDYSTSPISLRVEKESYFKENGILFSALNVDELKLKIDESQLYANVEFGQGGTVNEQGTTFPYYVTLLGFGEEKHNILGNCNIDGSLNLQTKFFTNSNDVQYLLENGVIGTEDWDRSIFIIQCDYDSGINWKANKGTWLGTLGYFYNELMNNANIIQRFVGFVPNSIVQFIGTGNLFQASRTPGIGTLNPLVSNEPVQFDDDYTPPNFDSNNNYGNGTPQGTPVSAINSRCSFPFKAVSTHRIYIETIAGGSAGNVTVTVKRYDAANVLLSYTQKIISFSSGLHVNNYFDLVPIYTDPTDYLTVDITFGINMQPDTDGKMYWACVSTGFEGELSVFDPEDISIYKNDFAYPMSVREMDVITRNPKGLIEFSRDGGVNKEYGWIDTIKHSPSTGIAQITLTSTKNLNKNGH